MKVNWEHHRIKSSFNPSTGTRTTSTARPFCVSPDFFCVFPVSLEVISVLFVSLRAFLLLGSRFPPPVAMVTFSYAEPEYSQQLRGKRPLLPTTPFSSPHRFSGRSQLNSGLVSRLTPVWYQYTLPVRVTAWKIFMHLECFFTLKPTNFSAVY